MTTLTLFSQGTTGQGNAGDPTAYTLGVVFSVSASGYVLDGIWFSSPPGAAALPQTIALYTVTGTLVHSEPATWSGAAASGWVKASFASPPALTSGTTYVAVVLQDTAADWYTGTPAYWTTGTGATGITNGALSAPNDTTAAGEGTHQNAFHSGTALTFPVSGNGSNYWIDPEVTNTLNVTGTLGLAMAPMAGSATGAETIHGTLAAAMAPMAESLTGHETGQNITGTLSLHMAPMAMQLTGPRGGYSLPLMAAAGII